MNLIGGGSQPVLNPLAAALMQGAMPDQTGAPSSATGGQLLQTGGAVPGSIPIGAPTNQFGNVPGAPAPTATPPINRPVAQPIASPLSAARQPAGPIGVPIGGPGGARPFGFGGYNRQPGY